MEELSPELREVLLTEFQRRTERKLARLQWMLTHFSPESKVARRLLRREKRLQARIDYLYSLRVTGQGPTTRADIFALEYL